MIDQRKYRLGDLTSVLTDYHANGSYEKLKEKVTLLDDPDYAVMIRTTNFEQNNFTNFKYITEEAYNFLSKSKVLEGDILMNKIANAGSVYYMPKLSRPVSLAMNLFLIRISKILANPKYVYIYLKQNEEYIKSFAAGSVTKTITKEAVKGLELELPSREVQDKIVQIISDFDDKIALNIRMSQTLEQMAQALFDKFFVKGVDISNLPEGWMKGKLGDEFNIIMGQSPEGSSYNEEGNGTPFFQGRTDFGFRFPSFRVYTTSPKRFARKFDVLISVRAPVGDLNLALTDCCIGRGLGAIRHHQGKLSYGYYKLRSLKNIFNPYNGEGTVFGSINKEELARIEVIIPPPQVISKFDKLVNPIDMKVYQLLKETTNLTTLRNTLLQKLLSGEIDITAINQNEPLHEPLLS